VIFLWSESQNELAKLFVFVRAAVWHIAIAKGFCLLVWLDVERLKDSAETSYVVMGAIL
jgi:hypothetical protein